MRKLLSLLLELLLCCPMTCAEEEPPVHTDGSFECVLQPDGSAEITEHMAGRELTVSEMLDGVMVKRIGDDAFSDCSSLILTVGRDSYAKRYAIDHDLRYPDALD